MHTCENMYMCVRVSVLCVSSHSLHPCAPHSRPRLVPPTFPRCARTGLLSLRGDVCSEVHSPLRGLWGPAFQLSQEGTPRERHGWHSKGGAAGPESPQAGPGGSLSPRCRGGGGAERGLPKDCSAPRLLPCLAAWCGCSAGSCAGCCTEGRVGAPCLALEVLLEGPEAVPLTNGRFPSQEGRDGGWAQRPRSRLACPADGLGLSVSLMVRRLLLVWAPANHSACPG